MTIRSTMRVLTEARKKSMKLSKDDRDKWYAISKRNGFDGGKKLPSASVAFSDILEILERMDIIVRREDTTVVWDNLKTIRPLSRREYDPKRPDELQGSAYIPLYGKNDDGEEEQLDSILVFTWYEHGGPTKSFEILAYLS